MTIAIFLAVLAAYVVVAVLLSRRIKNKDDFYVMGQQGSTLLIVGTLAATYLSAVTLMGIAGISYNEGPVVLAGLGSFGAWIGTLIAVIFVGRKLRALGCKTMMDFFDYRFNNKWVSIVALILMVIGLLGYGIIQLIGAGLVIAEIIDVPFPLIIIAFTLALLAFCSLSGMYGVVYTDTMMFFTMLAIAFLIAPILMDTASFEAMRNLGEQYSGYWTLAGTQDRPMGWSISQFLVWILFFACTPALVSRVFPAKSDLVVLKVGIIGIFFAPAMQVMVYLASAAMKVIDPSIEPLDRVMVVGFMEHTSPTLAGVGLAGLMASIMSTASTLFVLTGFALARDLYEKVFDKKVSERKGVTLGRVSQLLVALAVCTIAIAQPAGVYWISIYAGAIFAVAWLPTIVAALTWKRMNATAALASMLVGSISFVIVGELKRQGWIQLPANIDNLMVSITLGTLTLLVLAFLKSPSDHEIASFREIKQDPPSQATIRHFLAHKDGIKLLRREYYLTWLIMAITLAASAMLWGYLYLQLR